MLESFLSLFLESIKTESDFSVVFYFMLDS